MNVDLGLVIFLVRWTRLTGKVTLLGYPAYEAQHCFGQDKASFLDKGCTSAILMQAYFWI